MELPLMPVFVDNHDGPTNASTSESHPMTTTISAKSFMTLVDSLIGQRNAIYCSVYILGCTWPYKVDKTFPSSTGRRNEGRKNWSGTQHHRHTRQWDVSMSSEPRFVCSHTGSDEEPTVRG